VIKGIKFSGVDFLRKDVLLKGSIEVGPMAQAFEYDKAGGYGFPFEVDLDTSQKSYTAWARMYLGVTTVVKIVVAQQVLMDNLKFGKGMEKQGYEFLKTLLDEKVPKIQQEKQYLLIPKHLFEDE